MLDAHGAIDALVRRRDALDREIVALLPPSPWAVQVGRLRCLRGIDTLTLRDARAAIPGGCRRASGMAGPEVQIPASDRVVTGQPDVAAAKVLRRRAELP